MPVCKCDQCGCSLNAGALCERCRLLSEAVAQRDALKAEVATYLARCNALQQELHEPDSPEGQVYQAEVERQRARAEQVEAKLKAAEDECQTQHRKAEEREATITSLRAEVAEQGSVIEWIRAAQNGEEVSDFATSFPEVGAAMTHKTMLDHYEGAGDRSAKLVRGLRAEVGRLTTERDDLDARLGHVSLLRDDAIAEVGRLRRDIELCESGHCGDRTRAEQAEAEAERLQKRHELILTCAHCSASLLEQDTVPRCFGCVTTDEEDAAFFEARALLGEDEGKS